MMKIQSISDCISSVSAPIKRRIGATPSFCGAEKIAGDLSKKITENSPKFAKILTKLGQNNGEALNIIVTAIGTALVAPFFIAFNPLSKEDKDTKIYSAMRQPISAVIAVGSQLGITSQFNKWVKNLAAKDKIDMLKGLNPTDAAKSLKSIQKYGGIALSLLTLPLTCGLLNWAYPRIMEKFMPDVANAKAGKCEKENKEVRK